MGKQKQVKQFHPAPRLSDNQLDLELKKVKFKDIKKQFNFNEIKNKTWFRQYAKSSVVAKNKILKKVVEGIDHGKFTYDNPNELRGFLKEIKPDISKQQYNVFLSQIKQMENKYKQYEEKKQIKETRKERNIRLANQKGISYTEQSNGENSARSIAYRKRNNITTRGKENGYKLKKVKGIYYWIKE